MTECGHVWCSSSCAPPPTPQNLVKPQVTTALSPKPALEITRLPVEPDEASSSKWCSRKAVVSAQVLRGVLALGFGVYGLGFTAYDLRLTRPRRLRPFCCDLRTWSRNSGFRLNNVGARIIRLVFGGIVSYTYNKDPPKPYSNYLGLYISCPAGRRQSHTSLSTSKQRLEWDSRPFTPGSALPHQTEGLGLRV